MSVTAHAAHRPLKLLMVEDSRDDCELIVQNIKRGGFGLKYQRVEDEQSLRGALESLDWDLVISDYQMPRFSGLSAVKVVRSHPKYLPFILISGTIGEEVAVAAMKAGADNYLMKDNLTRLVPAIDRELRDADERRKNSAIERDLRKTEETLRQSQKLDALGRLSGGIAHDFNNILSSILLNAGELREQLKAPGPIPLEVEEIAKAAGRGALLVKQLLIFGKKQESTPVELDLNGVIQEMKLMLRRVIDRRIEMDLELADTPLWIRIDESQLEQVLMNLVVNAKDAIAATGRIVIRTERLEAEGQVRLSIEDTGSGISEEARARIFEPFFTTKETDKGTGLGLSIVYGIVKMNAGTIEVESQQGVGTKFQITLPEIQPAGNFPEPR